jgi:hypothetical protein
MSTMPEGTELLVVPRTQVITGAAACAATVTPSAKAHRPRLIIRDIDCMALFCACSGCKGKLNKAKKR